ncbi:UNVERIFIED_CONTAM: hypothetical protein GTU68_035705 [Idotea baltica]|nr:hypothetical protein [Idotea baltica]
MLYKSSLNIDGATQPIEIMDTSPCTDDVTEAHLQWADAFVLVYSIADKSSFKVVSHMLEVLSLHRPTCTILVVGAKLDLTHLREVEEIDGRRLALGHSCRFFNELSSAEGYDSVSSTFTSFLRELKYSRTISTSKTMSSSKGGITYGGNTSPKQRKISVSRMLGSLIGRASPPPTPITQLIVLDRSEFTKSKVPIRHL